MKSFALPVAVSRSATRITLAPHLIAETAGNPFELRRTAVRWLTIACAMAAAFVAGQIATLHAMGYVL